MKFHFFSWKTSELTRIRLHLENIFQWKDNKYLKRYVIFSGEKIEIGAFLNLDTDSARLLLFLTWAAATYSAHIPETGSEKEL